VTSRGAKCKRRRVSVHPQLLKLGGVHECLWGECTTSLFLGVVHCARARVHDQCTTGSCTPVEGYASVSPLSLWFLCSKQQRVDSKDVSSVYCIAQQIHAVWKLISVMCSTRKRQVVFLHLRLTVVSSKTPCLGVDRNCRATNALLAFCTRKPRVLERCLEQREGVAQCS
jgi:hypothetical protein